MGCSSFKRNKKESKDSVVKHCNISAVDLEANR